MVPMDHRDSTPDDSMEAKHLSDTEITPQSNGNKNFSCREEESHMNVPFEDKEESHISINIQECNNIEKKHDRVSEEDDVVLRRIETAEWHVVSHISINAQVGTHAVKGYARDVDQIWKPRNPIVSSSLNALPQGLNGPCIELAYNKAATKLNEKAKSSASINSSLNVKMDKLSMGKKIGRPRKSEKKKIFLFELKMGKRRKTIRTNIVPQEAIVVGSNQEKLFSRSYQSKDFASEIFETGVNGFATL